MMKLSRKNQIASLGFALALLSPLTSGTLNAEEVEAEAEVEVSAEEQLGITKKDGFVRFSSTSEELPEGTYQPWRVVRTLQKLQDNIVAGVPFSQDEYAAFLKEAAAEMLKLDDSIWQYERNLDAIAVFLMFGGANELGFKALKTTKLDLTKKIFLESALSFVERDITRAFGLMQLIDHTSLPPSMAAQLALAKSMTLSSSNLPLTQKYLREARRLAPNTLVEEAALRRLIRIAGETKSFENLKNLFETYLFRFPKSYYFNDYVRNVGFAVVRMPKRHEADVLAILEKLSQFTNQKQTASISVYVARYAAISGRKKLAKWASNKIDGKLRKGSKLNTRMEIYSAATKIIQEEKTAETMGHLAEIRSEILDQEDRRLLNAIKRIGERILLSNESVILEYETAMIETNQSDKEKQVAEERKTMVTNEVANHPVLNKADRLFQEVTELIPEDSE